MPSPLRAAGENHFQSGLNTDPLSPALSLVWTQGQALPAHPPFSSPRGVLGVSGEQGVGWVEPTDHSTGHSQLAAQDTGNCVGTLQREEQGLPIATSTGLSLRLHALWVFIL